MKVRCTSERLSDADERRFTELYLLPEHRPNWTFDVRKNEEYPVVALEIARGEAWVLLPAPIPRARWAPLSLFEVIDSEIQEGWGVYPKEHGLGIWWPCLNDPFFLDDVDECVEEALREYARIVRLSGG